MNGEQLKELGLERVEENANQEWLECAIDSVRHIAVDNRTLTSDDIWAYLQQHFPNVKTHNPSAMGAVMRIASKKGIIAPTSIFITSNRPSAHNRTLRVWASQY